MKNKKHQLYSLACAWLCTLTAGSDTLGSSEKNLPMLIDTPKFSKVNPIGVSDKVCDLIKNKTVTQSDTILGVGSFGGVFLVKIPDDQWEYAVKKGILNNEGRIGKDIQNAYNNIGENTLISNVQGFQLMTPGTLIELAESQGEFELIQRRVNGTTLLDSLNRGIFPYSNGYVDDPQKAIERLCGLVLTLHSLHEQGITHGDFHIGNIMIEKVPPQGCTDETELKKLSADQYEYRFVTVDLGSAQLLIKPGSNIKNLSPGAKICIMQDICNLGAIIPKILFGRGGFQILSIAQKYREFEHAAFLNRANDEDKQLIKDSQKELNKMTNRITGLEQRISDCVTRFNKPSCTSEQKEFNMTKYHELQQQCSEVEKIISDLQNDVRNKLNYINKEDVKNEVKQKISQYIFNQFETMNNKVGKEKSYPEPVLKVIAQIVKSCAIGKNCNGLLIINQYSLVDKKQIYEDFFEKFPEEFPTTGEILEQLQNLAFSDWSKGKYEIEGYDNEY
jgi:serine/threonine protein kinase